MYGGARRHAHDAPDPCGQRERSSGDRIAAADVVIEIQERPSAWTKGRDQLAEAGGRVVGVMQHSERVAPVHGTVADRQRAEVPLHARDVGEPSRAPRSQLHAEPHIESDHPRAAAGDLICPPAGAAAGVEDDVLRCEPCVGHKVEVLPVQEPDVGGVHVVKARSLVIEAGDDLGRRANLIEPLPKELTDR